MRTARGPDVRTPGSQTHRGHDVRHPWGASLSLRWEGVPERSATRPTRTAKGVPQGARITSSPGGAPKLRCVLGGTTQVVVKEGAPGKGRLGADCYDTESISRNKQSCFVVALQDRENAWASPAGWMCSGQGGGCPPELAIQRGDESKAVMRFLAKA